LTNRVAMNGAPVSPDDALKAWHKLSDDPRRLNSGPEVGAISMLHSVGALPLVTTNWMKQCGLGWR
jgi:hypothetical protein